EAGGVHRSVERLPREVERHEYHVRWQGAERAAESRRLHRLRGGVVDLEHPAAFDARDPVGAAVEPGPEDHHLLDLLPQRVPHDIVDEAGPGDARGARPGPPAIDVPGHEPPHHRETRQADDRAQRWPKEATREAVAEQPCGSRTTNGLQRTEERHELRRPARLVRSHAASIPRPCRHRQRRRQAVALACAKSRPVSTTTCGSSAPKGSQRSRCSRYVFHRASDTGRSVSRRRSRAWTMVSGARHSTNTYGRRSRCAAAPSRRRSAARMNVASATTPWPAASAASASSASVSYVAARAAAV